MKSFSKYLSEMAKLTLNRNELIEFYIELNNKIMKELYYFKKDSEISFKYAIMKDYSIEYVDDFKISMLDKKIIYDNEDDFFKADYSITKNNAEFLLIRFYLYLDKKQITFIKNNKLNEYYHNTISEEIPITTVDKVFEQLWKVISEQIIDCISYMKTLNK